ncbi:MAG: hypothetical protein ACK4RK_03785 [Gemmataceae bacterium]
MSKEKPYCEFCGTPIDLGREFAYQLEVQHFAEKPAALMMARATSPRGGFPRRTCKECQASIEANWREIEEEQQSAARGFRFLGRLFLIGCLPVALFFSLSAAAAVIRAWTR